MAIVRGEGSDQKCFQKIIWTSKASYLAEELAGEHHVATQSLKDWHRRAAPGLQKLVRENTEHHLSEVKSALQKEASSSVVACGPEHRCAGASSGERHGYLSLFESHL